MQYVFIMIVSGICVSASLYLVYMAIRFGDKGGVWLFSSFGLLFGIPLIVSIIKLIAKKSKLFRRIDTVIIGKSEPKTTFVPHWFMMTAIIITGTVILATILISVLCRMW